MQSPRLRKRQTLVVVVVKLAEAIQKPKEVELLDALLIELPQQETADGITTHEAVEETRDPVGAPDELTLDRGQRVLSGLDSLERLLDRDRRLVRQGCDRSGELRKFPRRTWHSACERSLRGLLCASCAPVSP